MGILKIDDDLHEEVRKAGSVMCRSINAQAEFWMRIGMIAEANPGLTFNEIVRQQFRSAGVRIDGLHAAGLAHDQDA